MPCKHPLSLPSCVCHLLLREAEVSPGVAPGVGFPWEPAVASGEHHSGLRNLKAAAEAAGRKRESC